VSHLYGEFVKLNVVDISIMPTKLMFTFDLIIAYPSSTFLHITCTSQFITAHISLWNWFCLALSYQLG